MVLQKSFKIIIIIIFSIILLGIAGLFIKYKMDINRLKELFQLEKQQVVSEEKQKIERRFTYLYQAIR